MAGRRVSRREFLAAGAATGAALALDRSAAVARATGWSRTLDFRSVGEGDGWPGWACVGVANLRRAGARGVLEAGSDVFPCDPRPVAFALDQRFRDGEVSALMDAAGAGAGVVARRVGPREYYLAMYDDERLALVIARRSPAGLTELARTGALPPLGTFRLSLAVHGSNPTVLRATLAGVGETSASASDSAPHLQRPGDPGVLATARTLFPSKGPPGLAALGNLHLLPYGIQEGQAIMKTAVGEVVLSAIRERSTAVFREISVNARGRRGITRPSVVAATTGPPRQGGAILRVATDVPAEVEIELAESPSFRGARRLRPRHASEFDSALIHAAKLARDRRIWWRARLRRHGHESVGPVRSFRLPPSKGGRGAAKIAIAACASQFGPIFDQLTGRDPDVFVWQGDLNYADTLGPLAQTMTGYAGIWRDFFANPRLAVLLERVHFAAQRDDHDYGVQDANSTNLVPWGIRPWQKLIERRRYYSFSAGAADFWVLDQRRFKSDPEEPDTPAKTLLGRTQRSWLLRTLKHSRAPFKVICSPCTLAPLPANARDGSWAAGYTAERDLLLGRIRKEVSGQTLFVTGDTHWTLVYDRDGLFEARPCPLCIPVPNDITLTQPAVAELVRGTPGVLYADDQRGHFAMVEVTSEGRRAALELALVREDGATTFRRRFEQPLRPRERRGS